MNAKTASITALLITATAVLFPSRVLPSSSLKDLKLPVEIGTVGEFFQSRGLGENAGKTIIYIQDAHCNYEAQMNLVKILVHLIQTRDLKLILVEGGSGDISLTSLRLYADEEKRAAIAEDYLRKGKISGEEYLDITSDFDIELFGVEDQELYEKNMDAFTAIEPKRKDCLAYLDKVKSVLDALIPSIYNERLRAFRDQVTALSRSKGTLTDYYAFLKKAAHETAVPLQDYPHLVNFVESAEIEKQIDLQQAQAQRDAFLSALAMQVDEQQAQGLIEHTRAFQANALTQNEYFSFLLELASGKIAVADDFPQFWLFTRYESLGNAIDVAALIKEAAHLEEAVRQKLFRDNNERRLAQINQAQELLVKLFSLELTPEEEASMFQNPGDFVIAGWNTFLDDSCRRYGLKMLPPASGPVDEMLDSMKEFYRAGREREKAFFANILKKMNDSEESLAVFISGGFHTPGLSRLLREAGLSYAVVTPQVTQKGDSSVYFSVLRGDAYQDEYEEVED